MTKSTKRKSIGNTKRFNIFKRDEFTCQYCGNHPPKVILHLDHIHPVSKGGDNSEDNLITSCFECNMGKGAKLLDRKPEALKDKAARIAETEAQIAGYSRILAKKRERIETEAWQVINIFTDEGEIRKDWFRSVAMFIEKLGVIETMEAMDIAISAKSHNHETTQFKYFCGVCWKKIKKEGDE